MHSYGPIPKELIVPITVMPKGVEHIERRYLSMNGPDVPITVMPKGVEHIRFQWKEFGEGVCQSQ